MRFFSFSAAALLLLAPAVVAAQEEPDPVADRTISLVVYGDDRCPESTEDEIVVCARRPESERYRIPKALRNEGDRPLERSMVSRMEELEEVTRDTMPGGCSAVGSFGQSGCRQQMLNQWYRERRARKRGN